MAKPLPQAAYRLHPKRGSNDCAIVVLATFLRRDPGEVLIAASKVRKDVWQHGLEYTQIIRTATKLGIKARWTKVFAVEEETGFLWVSYNDVATHHAVFLHEGAIFDPDHDPISLWLHDDYFVYHNAFPAALLRIEE
jgi:hypothetical protein